MAVSDSFAPFERPRGWVTTQTVDEVIANVRHGALPRTCYTIVMALISLAMLPIWLAALWLAFIVAWEIALRPHLENRLALPAARRSQAEGFGWLAAINVIGATAYTIYPVMIWRSGEAMGMVLATAWICGSANHLFVYFSANRALLLSCVIPLAALSLSAPLMTTGLSLESAISISSLGALMLAAGMFGFDRRALLTKLARDAEARASAEQANAAKSQFLSTMSHELRSPLNAVIGYAELIEEEAEAGPIAEDATKIRTSARQLLGVIDLILDLSKLETGAIVLRRERGLGSAILQQLSEAALPLAAAGNNRLTVSEAGALGEAEIDHMRLHQCLMQLVSNAAKFTRDGEIRISARREQLGTIDRLIFSVSDTGAGISAEDQARIFEPFVQGERAPTRRADGAGLGLALVRRLARLMGGDVSCESSPGQGSTFNLWIDAAPAR
ncbi:MAG: HAMP domain-containing histidine kinase [Hyphomonadaceae bacterium]|nr:HAMP domain-containing histidine kinase [Hyphomonadaceae bacterium]